MPCPGVLTHHDGRQARWKDRVTAAAEGAKIHVAIDSVDGRLLGDVADLLAEGTGTVINFGSLHGETSDVRVFSPRPLTLKGRALRPSDAAATGATPSRDRRSGFDLFIPVKELTVCPETSC